MKKQPLFLIAIVSLFLITSCASVDLRPDELVSGNVQGSIHKGRALLNESKKAMGYDKLASTEVYESTTTYKWKPFWLMMPMNAFPGSNKKEVQLRFATNSFDGQIEYLEGRKKGKIVGLQSWEGYKKEIDNRDYLKRHEHDRYLWGLATFHYLTEAPMHLPDAEIVKYAGTREFNNVNYDLVYVTWGTEEPNKQYDRFLVYINPETKFIDLIEATISDYFLPMPKGMQHATVQYERKKTSIGAYLPSKSTIQLKSPKKKERFVYLYEMDNYKFDSFDKDILYPIEGLLEYGLNKKPTK